MNAKHEYEFIANFKVLQNIFKAHKVEKVRGHHATVWQTLLNFLEAHSCRKTCEMQNAVRSHLNRSQHCPLSLASEITLNFYNGSRDFGIRTSRVMDTILLAVDVVRQQTPLSPLRRSHLRIEGELAPA